jgi:adenine-specific DNA-methyltransferase
MVDTRHFTQQFRDKLLADIDNIDEQTDGVMINADNFQAMKVMENCYRQQIQCIYIDPPYNTDASKILYKNNYEHSSWCALMYDRIKQGKLFLSETGLQSTAIDEYELKELYAILQDLFGRNQNAGIIAIRINPSGRPREGGLALSHEYTLVFRNTDNAQISKIDRSEEQAKRYDKFDENGAYEQRNFRREGSNSDRADGIRQWYPIYVDKESMQIRVPEMQWNIETELWDILEEATVNEAIIYPITDEGREKNWRWAWENVKKDYSQFYAIKQKSGIQVYYKFRPNESGVSPLTFWDDKRYSATENGTKLLKGILPTNDFSYPKSIYAVEDMLKITGLKNGVGIVLDYFAGSGTTGHAVINLNREDGGSRKYILVEMGEYFSKVTQPRIKKVVYASEWKDGKPKSRTTGVSHIMKYMRLESYEDALSNIELKKQGGLSLWGEDYLINYMLNMESRDSLLSIDKFRSPFEYKMRITEKNECRERQVDVCETFNYLIGLKVMSQSVTTYYSAEKASSPAYDGAVELRKDDGGLYGFRQIEGVLPDGRKALVIWRTITDNTLASNAALDAYFSKYRINPAEREYDIIYVNGDNNLENLRTDEEQWKVVMIEKEFNEKMWEE